MSMLTVEKSTNIVFSKLHDVGGNKAMEAVVWTTIFTGKSWTSIYTTGMSKVLLLGIIANI